MTELSLGTSIFTHSRRSMRQQVVAILFPAALLFLCPIVFAGPLEKEALSVLIMPIPNADRESIEQFDQNNVSAEDFRFNKLSFNESPADWNNAEIDIGYHDWFCSQLQAFAEIEGINVHVRFILWPQALNDIDALGKKFDIIQIPSTWTAHLINAGILAKWDGDVDLSNYTDASLNTCRVNGKNDIYAVPWHIDLRVLFYRRELTSDENKLLTFDKFRKCLEERKKQVESDSNKIWKPFCISTDKDWDILHNTLGYFWNRNILEEYLWFWHRPVFNTEQGMEGIRKLRNLADNKLVCFKEFGDPVWKGQAEELLDGNYDAVFGGFHMRVVFERSPEIEILAAPLPQLVTGFSKTFLGGSHLALTNTAVSGKRAELASRLIEKLTGKNSGISMFRHTDAIPANKQALKQVFENELRWKNLNLDELLESGEPYPSIPEWAELEKNVARDNFHNIILNIAKPKEPFQTIELNVETAAREVKNIVGVPLWIWWAFIAGLVTAIILFFVLYKWWSSAKKGETKEDELKEGIRKDVKELKEKLDIHDKKITNEVISRFDELSSLIKQVPEILQTLNAAKQEIIGRIDASDQDLPHMFALLSENVGTVHKEIESLQNEISSSHAQGEKTLVRVEKIMDDLDETDVGIEKIVSFIGQTPESLARVEDWLEALWILVDKIHKKVIPKEKKVPLYECDVIADILCEQNVVGLEIKICHSGLVKASKKEWRRLELPLLFELLALRMWDSQNFTKTYLLRSDYYSVSRSYSDNWSPAFVFEDPKGTISRMYRHARSEVFKFFNRFCLMKNSKPIRPKDFMIRPPKEDRHFKTISLGQPNEDEDGMDIRVITGKDGKRHVNLASSLPPSGPPYEFVLPTQVQSFKCNIIEKANECDKSKLLADQVCDILIDCNRCLPAWEELSNFGTRKLKSLARQKKDFINDKKEVMLESDVKRFEQLLSFWRGLEGKQLLMAFGEDPEEELEKRRDTLEKVLNVLNSI